MENRAYALAVGLFTLLLGVGVVFAAMWLTGDTESRDTYRVESRYPVSGLNVQAPVRFRGVDVGRVESVTIDPVNPRSILIAASVRVGTPITHGTYAKLGSQGVTGLAFLALDDDGDKPQPLSAAQSETRRIPMRRAYLDELAETGQTLVADANEVARRLSALLSEPNQARLLSTLAALEEATRAITTVATRLEPTLRKLPALADDTRQAVARADELLGNMNKLTLELTQRVNTLERVSRSAEQIGGAASSFSRAAVDDTLPRVNALLEELARNSRQLDRLLGELNERPSSLVIGRPVPAPGPGEPGFSSGGGNR